MAGYRHLEINQDFEKYVKSKKDSSKAYYKYFLARLLRMFQYKGLPDTIPHEILDRYLFEEGIACITKIEDKLYVFQGNLGGEQDVYYRPTRFIISNPHIQMNGEKFSAEIEVFPRQDNVAQPTGTQEGVLIRNDSEWIGMHPLIARYAYLMAENTLTLRTADVMLRIIALITAKTDAERASALEYLKSIEKGELGVIGESSFHEGVEMQSPPSNNGSYLTQFIEYQQYLKGSFFNEIGLSANYNMKREAIGKGESTLDSDSILPLCENMLKCRREDLEKVNQLYGTNIEVEFSSAWLQNKVEILSSLNTSSSFGGQPIASPTNDSGMIQDDSGNGSGMGQVGSGKNQDESGNEAVKEDVKEDNETGNETGNEEICKDMIRDMKDMNGDMNDMSDDDENSESRINDLSVDEELTEALEKLSEGDDMNVNEESEKSEDKEDISDN